MNEVSFIIIDPKVSWYKSQVINKMKENLKFLSAHSLTLVKPKFRLLSTHKPIKQVLSTMTSSVRTIHKI